MSSPITILHVCTGNIGRSPMAERMMAARLGKKLGDASAIFDVSSAGTHAVVHANMEPFSAAVLRQCGINADEFVARALTPALVQGADLVLTATREHRSHVVGLVPGAVRRTFTLKEFARLTSLVREERASLEPDSRPRHPVVEAVRARIDIAGRVRGLESQPHPDRDDIEDPIGAPAEVYQARGAEIDQACTQAVALMLGLDH